MNSLQINHERLGIVLREIEETSNIIKPLMQKLERLNLERRNLQSRLFIDRHEIKKDDVEMSTGDGKPWFGFVSEFSAWMRDNRVTKPWAEWNGTIYHTRDLIGNVMPEMPGKTADLQK